MTPLPATDQRRRVDKRLVFAGTLLLVVLFCVYVARGFGVERWRVVP